MNQPEIVCLIGSSRFGPLHIEAMRRETLAGKIVLIMGLFGHAEGLDMDGPVKKMLDELHLRKIDLADTVLVINGKIGSTSLEKPYIGQSTRNELAYARKNGKKVRWWQLPDDNAREGEGT